MIRALKTFIDTGVLLAGYSGPESDRRRVYRILANGRRRFVVSPFLLIELLPHATHNRRQNELLYYQQFVSTALLYKNYAKVIQLAHEEAARCDIKAIDALHVASACLSGCQELITTEKATKLMYRTKLIRVLRLSDTES